MVVLLLTNQSQNLFLGYTIPGNYRRVLSLGEMIICTQTPRVLNGYTRSFATDVIAAMLDDH